MSSERVCTSPPTIEFSVHKLPRSYREIWRLLFPDNPFSPTLRLILVMQRSSIDLSNTSGATEEAKDVLLEKVRPTSRPKLHNSSITHQSHNQHFEMVSLFKNILNQNAAGARSTSHLSFFSPEPHEIWVDGIDPSSGCPVQSPSFLSPASK